jgi:hypothetical protein
MKFIDFQKSRLRRTLKNIAKNGVCPSADAVPLRSQRTSRMDLNTVHRQKKPVAITIVHLVTYFNGQVFVCFHLISSSGIVFGGALNEKARNYVQNAPDNQMLYLHIQHLARGMYYSM